MMRGRFHKLFLRPRAQLLRQLKASQKVGHRAQMDRDISMIRTLRPTFMKSTQGKEEKSTFLVLL